MSTDFRVNRIVTLAAATRTSLESIRAIRAGAGLAYKLDRLALSQVAKGANYEVDCGGGVSAIVDRMAARYVGDSADGTAGTAAYNIAIERLASSYKGRSSAASEALRTYAIGDTVAAGETVKVYIDGVLKTVTTDYTIVSTDVVFVDGHAPLHGRKLEIKILGSETPGTNETVKVTVEGTLKTLTTHYTISGGVLTFTAGNVPLVDEDIQILFRTPGTVAWVHTGEGADEGSSAAGTLKVYVDEVLQTLTTNYTYNAGTNTVTFVTASIPAAAAVVRIAWSYAVNNRFLVPLAMAASGEVRQVYVGSTLQTITTDYTVGDGDPDPVGTIVFVTAHEPAEDAVVTVRYVTAAEAVVVAGGVTFFDTQRQNTPAWDNIIAGAEKIVEVM